VLAPVLHVNREELLARLSDKHFDFAYLARRVSDKVVAAVKKLELPGIGFVPESARRYPADPLAGSLIGHVGGEGSGLEGGNGLEYLYDKLLAGTDGKLVVERDQQGLDIPNTASQKIEARRGSDLVLTLDESLQWQAEQALIDQVTATNAKGGMAAVVDVTTGAVLALASVDGASAKGPARPSGAGEINQPLMELFEPGSTNKAHHALDRDRGGRGRSGHHDRRSDRAASGRCGVHRRRSSLSRAGCRCPTSCGNRRTSAPSRSHSTCRRTAWPARCARSGSDRAPASTSPGRRRDSCSIRRGYYDTGLASTAIGYGVAVTGMQMLDAYATIANGGVTRPPRLLDATIDWRGRKRHPALERRGRRVVSPKRRSR